jgi:pteridine reductase
MPVSQLSKPLISKPLNGQVALVTGAGRRVGQAIAVALGEAGAHVAVHYNESQQGADETVKQVRAHGVNAEIFQADLRDTKTHEHLLKDVVSKFGRVDILVNSAAIMERTPVRDITPEKWDATMSLNLKAPFFLSLAFVKERPALTIINIADVAAFETWANYIPHSISKAGVVYMTRSLARTFAPRVRVNAVAPGAVLLPDDWSKETGENMAKAIPLRRLGTPQDVAQAVVYLASAQYVTGETIIVDGGKNVL